MVRAGPRKLRIFYYYGDVCKERFDCSKSVNIIKSETDTSFIQQPEYEKDLNRKEQEKLKAKVSTLSKEDKTEIYNKGEREYSLARGFVFLQRAVCGPGARF